MGLKLTPQLQYIANTLRSQTVFGLPMLHEILYQMTGIPPPSPKEMGDELIEVQAGGPKLYEQVSSCSKLIRPTKPEKKCCKKIINSCLKEEVEEMGVLSLLLLSQQQDVITQNNRCEYLKILCDHIDKNYLALLHIVEIIHKNFRRNWLSEKAITSLDYYNKNFFLSPESKFYLYEPLFNTITTLYLLEEREKLTAIK